jgi:hypothetical protein
MADVWIMVALSASLCAFAVLAGIWQIYCDFRRAIIHIYTGIIDNTHVGASRIDVDIAEIYAGEPRSASYIRQLATPAGRRAALHNIAKKTGADIENSGLADALMEIVATRVLRDFTRSH